MGHLEAHLVQLEAQMCQFEAEWASLKFNWLKLKLEWAILSLKLEHLSTMSATLFPHQSHRVNPFEPHADRLILQDDPFEPYVGPFEPSEASNQPI